MEKEKEMVSIKDKITDYETASATLIIVTVILSILVIVLIISLVGMKSKLDKYKNIGAFDMVDNRVTGMARVDEDKLNLNNSEIEEKDN